MGYECLAGLSVAVIGAGGFLGTGLCNALQANNVAVLPFTRSEPAEVDGWLHPALRNADTVVYLASSVTPGYAEEFPKLAHADHDCFERLIRGLTRLRAEPKFIFASSSTSYDPSSQPPYTEESPVKPETVHGETKLRMENTLLKFSDSVSASVLRLASVYGPGHPRRSGHGVISHWLHLIAENQPITVIGQEDTRRDFVYIDDVVDAICRVIDPQVKNLPAILNIGSGAPTSLKDLLRKISAVTCECPAINWQPARSFDRRELWLDIELAELTIGWLPRTSLNFGLRETWDSVRPAGNSGLLQ